MFRALFLIAGFSITAGTAAVPRSTASAYQEDDLSERDFLELLHESCLTHADTHLKDPELVRSFCSFIPHIARKHYQELRELATIGEKFSFDVLHQAMDDLVHWRTLMFVEDRHRVAEQFVDFARKRCPDDRGHQSSRTGHGRDDEL